MPEMKPIDEQLKLIRRGTEEIIDEGELREKLSLARPLVIKAGFDPSAPDIHIGHTVLLRKMRHFQELGHDVHFLIGDFTGRIGDPSGRSKLRRQLTAEEVAENAGTYKKQIFKILDKEKTKVVFNSKWCSRLGEEGLFDLASRYTVARMLERDDFLNRYKNNAPISILEFLYPLLQGYDSVVMESDVEMGGTDQKFNLLVGRALQRNYASEDSVPEYLKRSMDLFRQDNLKARESSPPNFEPQVIVTMPILEGLDGTEKMSKSLNNYVGISEAPEQMFGKIMSISDDLMWRYYELLTDTDHDTLKKEVDLGKLHPKEAKARLAGDIVCQYHGPSSAEEARVHFETVFGRRENPDNMAEIFINKELINIIDLIRKAGFASSSNEARRLVEQKAVSVEGERVTDAKYDVPVGTEGLVLKVGKRKFARIKRS
jgi:tyrosyl-tRNA synthetase